MRRPATIVAVGLVLGLVGLIVFLNAAFVVDETEQAVVVRLGRAVHLIVGNRTEEQWAEIQKTVVEFNKTVGADLSVSRGAGLYFKTPFVDDVRIFDDRILEYDSKPAEIVTRDKKQMLVDNYARWRIVDPLLFLQNVKDEVGAQPRLDDRIFSALREHLSKADMVEIVRSTNDLLEEYPDLPLLPIRDEFGREATMARVTAQVDEEMAKNGIRVLDVRIKRADLLKKNEEAVFDRMKAERNRISEQNRAEGKKEQQKIQADADRQVEVILAEANRKAEVLLGEGDAQAAGVYAKAYEPHVEFYEFIRSLDAMRAAMNEKTRIVISTKSPIFEYLKGR